MNKPAALIVSLCVAALCQCVAPGLSKADQVLEGRARTFWEARIKTDWSALYHYLPPWETNEIKEDEFTASAEKKAGISFLSYELKGSEAEGELGWVRILYTGKPAGIPQASPRTTEIWQVWEKIDGEWFPVQPNRAKEAPRKPPSLRPAAEEAELTIRADELWGAKEKQQWGVIYDLLDPEFRKNTSKEEFLGMKALYLYLGHKIEWAEVTGDRGKVKILYSIKPADPYLAKLDPQEETLLEDWVKIEDKWYRLTPTEGVSEAKPEE